jgi:hypothetical protein
MGTRAVSMDANTEIQPIIHVLSLCNKAILGTMDEIVTGTGRDVLQQTERNNTSLNTYTHSVPRRGTYSRQTFRLLVSILRSGI